MVTQCKCGNFYWKKGGEHRYAQRTELAIVRLAIVLVHFLFGYSKLASGCRFE